MCGKKWFFFIFFIFYAAGGYSQITITENQVALYNAVGTTSVSNLDTITASVNIGNTSGVNTWDFSGLVSNINFTTTCIDAVSSPYHSTFPNSTICRKYTVSFMGFDTNNWLYNSLDANGFYLDGQVTATSFIITITNTTVYSPSEMQIKLPLTLGTTWSQDYTSTTTSSTGGGSTVWSHHVSYTADAYGSLKLPGESGYVQALRLKREEVSSSGQLYDHLVGYIFMTESGSGVSVTAVDTLQPDHGVINVMSSAWVVENPTSVKESDNISTESYLLNQNYPNPFNPVTTISWKSSTGGRQILKIYNVLGKEIATLVDEYRPAGDYEVKFDGSILSSGIYFYKLECGDFISVKKMTLLK